MKVRGAIELWTDGACHPNPGIGGVGVVVLNPVTGTTFELAKGPFEGVTNNMMEMTAAKMGLDWLHRRAGPLTVVVYSDSKYLVNGMTKWIHGWQARDWNTGEGKPVKNYDLWQGLIRSRARHTNVIFQWVRGHNGNRYNERADEIAVMAKQGIWKGPNIG